MTSVVALTAVVVGAGAASACEWYKTEAMASAAPAPQTEQQPVAATKVDPQLLAWLGTLGKDAILLTSREQMQAK
jgi:hypothetical protein